MKALNQHSQTAVTDRVVTPSFLKVLTPLEVSRGIQTVLVPVDGSERSVAQLRAAAAVVGQLKANLVIVYVYERSSYAPPHMSPRSFDQSEAAIERRAVARLREIRDDLADLKVVSNATLVTVSGFFQDEVIALAQKVEADLIIVSTHCYEGLKRIFLGSKAANVVNHASCPVLVLPMPE